MEKDNKGINENLHENHRQRVFARLESGGLDSFYDHEIIELILFYTVPRRDTNPIAHRLINEFGSMSGVMDADIGALEKVPGVSRKSAVLLKLIPQLSRRYNLAGTEPGTVLDSFEKASKYAKDLMTGETREVYYILCLDIKNRLIKAEKLKEGTAAEIAVNPRSAVLAAAGKEAAGVILVHNHPRGGAQPSSEDISMTHKTALALGLIGIPVLDHIIAAEDGVFSFKREGLMADVTASATAEMEGAKNPRR